MKQKEYLNSLATLSYEIVWVFNRFGHEFELIFYQNFGLILKMVKQFRHISLEFFDVKFFLKIVLKIVETFETSYLVCIFIDGYVVDTEKHKL